MDLAQGAVLVHLLAHSVDRKTVRGGIVPGRGVILFGPRVQVLNEGNEIDLLDDVGNFPEHLTEDDGRHGRRGTPRSPPQSNQP